MPSIDPLRATFGRKNSVNNLSPDLEAPQLLRGRFNFARELLIEFSGPINPNVLISIFSFEPFLKVDSTYAVSTRQLQLIFGEPIPDNVVFLQAVNGLIDCWGNSLGKNSSLQLVLPKIALLGDLLINELLIHPKTGSPKFVELINVTDNYLEIGSWYLGSA